MEENTPAIRRDLEFFPVRHGGQQLVVVRDPLGLVQEGKALAPALCQVMALLDGTGTKRDIQMALMRQQGGVLVGMEEVEQLLAHLDESFLLDSERFKQEKGRIVEAFAAERVRRPSHCGRAYPDRPGELGERLDEILGGRPDPGKPEGELAALVGPHIDLSVGARGYAGTYRYLPHADPLRIVVLGVGHQMGRDLFCLTEKDFETPLGLTGTDRDLVRSLTGAGRGIVAENDFAHRAEHSIEFQVLFIQHLMRETPVTLVPILCGFLQACLPEYHREAYLEKAGPFLEVLAAAVADPARRTLVVAGVDFSHVGPKFGHEEPADRLTPLSEAHDRKLLDALCRMDAEGFWEESRRVEDRFNVCGFSALACLLEILPPCTGKTLHYETWYEEATRSAVSFGAAVFERMECWSAGVLE